MLTEYISGTSLLHGLDVRTKAAWLLAVVALAFALDHPFFALILLSGVLALFTLSGISFAGIRRVLVTLLPVLAVMVAVTAFSHAPEEFHAPDSRRILFYLFPNNVAPLTVGGILLSVTFLCRILVMVLTSMLFTYTTPVDDVLQLSRMLRMPYSVAFILTTAIRFIPTLEAKAQMVMDAQRCRGVEFGSGSFIRRIRAYGSIMIPMIVDSIRMSEDLAVALMNRGFSGSSRSTVLVEIRMSVRDYLLLVTAVVMLIAVVFLRVNHVGQL